MSMKGATMSETRTLVVIGGTAGIGRVIAERAAARGDTVVITGRDQGRASTTAQEIGRTVRGVELDLAAPEHIAESLAALSGIDSIDDLVIGAVERDQNSVTEYDVQRAVHLVTLKLVGYTEVIHQLLVPLQRAGGSVVLFGGLAKDRPYPGSTTVSTVNGGVTGLVRTLAVELMPIRVNAVHPGIIGDSPYWNVKPDAVLEGIRSRTPTGRLASMADVADAVEFLLRNPSTNGVNLDVDGGWMLL